MIRNDLHPLREALLGPDAHTTTIGHDEVLSLIDEIVELREKLQDVEDVILELQPLLSLANRTIRDRVSISNGSMVSKPTGREATRGTSSPE